MPQFVRLLRHHWFVFVASVALVVAGAYAATNAVTPVYAANVKLFVSADSADPRLGDAYAMSQFIAAQVHSIATLATTPRVTEPVAEALGLGATADLGPKISATVPDGTVLVDVTVKDPNPTLARDIANGIGEQLPIAVSDVESAGQERLTKKSPLRVTVVEQAVAPTTPVSPHLHTNLLLGALLGLAVGSCLALFRERTKPEPVPVAAVLAPAPARPRVRSRGDADDIERVVLGLDGS
jgi:capsular polysaccharide biosynthesis protein